MGGGGASAGSPAGARGSPGGGGGSGALLPSEAERLDLAPGALDEWASDGAAPSAGLPGMFSARVHSVDDIMTLMAIGNSLRARSSTELNTLSSRSHVVLVVRAACTDRQSGAQTVGRMHLIDLAGSEDAGRSGARAAGGRLQEEAAHINRSLQALGRVMRAHAARVPPDEIDYGQVRTPRDRLSHRPRLAQRRAGGISAFVPAPALCSAQLPSSRPPEPPLRLPPPTAHSPPRPAERAHAAAQGLAAGADQDGRRRARKPKPEPSCRDAPDARVRRVRARHRAGQGGGARAPGSGRRPPVSRRRQGEAVQSG